MSKSVVIKWQFKPMYHKLGLEPEVLDKYPTSLLRITYENNVKVENGNALTPTQAKNEPHVVWEANPNIYHVLLMIDPDLPSRKDPTYREWQQWLVGNIPGNDVSKGDVLSEYIGPVPMKGTDVHRLLFLLYQQKSKLTFTIDKITNRRGTGRENFNSRKFSKKFNLGEPVAANCFVAEWDSYVPILYKQLGYMPLNLNGIM